MSYYLWLTMYLPILMRKRNVLLFVVNHVPSDLDEEEVHCWFVYPILHILQSTVLALFYIHIKLQFMFVCLSVC